jgi:hypothetical protein
MAADNGAASDGLGTSGLAAGGASAAFGSAITPSGTVLWAGRNAGAASSVSLRSAPRARHHCASARVMVEDATRAARAMSRRKHMAPSVHPAVRARNVLTSDEPLTARRSPIVPRGGAINPSAVVAARVGLPALIADRCNL